MSMSHVALHVKVSTATGLLAVLLQQLSRPEATEASLDPRRRGLNGLLSLPHQEAANTRLDLRRRLLLERLPSVLSLQQMLFRLHVLLLLLLVPLLVLLILLLRLLTTTLRGFLQLLPHAVPAEIGLNLRCRRVGLHRVGVLLRRLRHERNSEPVTRSSVSRLLKSVRSVQVLQVVSRRPTPQKFDALPDCLQRSLPERFAYLQLIYKAIPRMRTISNYSWLFVKIIPERTDLFSPSDLSESKRKSE